MWILEEDADGQDRTTFRMPAGAIKTIGRSTGAEFILDVPLVSRLHCQLSATEHTLDVKDLGSTNGTFVNGRRVGAASLQAGDRLRVGRAEFTIKKD